jgi:hypothetical protein
LDLPIRILRITTTAVALRVPELHIREIDRSVDGQIQGVALRFDPIAIKTSNHSLLGDGDQLSEVEQKHARFSSYRIRQHFFSFPTGFLSVVHGTEATAS